jgi:hypothetical protein
MGTQVAAIGTPARTTPPIPRSVNTSKLFATIGVVANDNGEAERGLDHDGTIGWMSEAHRLSLGANRSGGGAMCTASIGIMQKRA